MVFYFFPFILLVLAVALWDKTEPFGDIAKLIIVKELNILANGHFSLCSLPSLAPLPQDQHLALSLWHKR